tara:strand:+ start:44 stop:598 length:555 start_codon:yes stop_codon:yes gene_type:complete
MTEKITDSLLETMRRSFVEGVENDQGIREYPTVEKLCASYNVSRASLYRKSSYSEWQQQRNEWQSEFTQTLNMKRAKEMAYKAAKLDEASLKIAQMGLSKVTRKLSDSIEGEKHGQDSLTIKEFHDLMDTALRSQKMGKLALGQADEITKVVSDDGIPHSLTRLINQLDELAEEKSQGAVHLIQ